MVIKSLLAMLMVSGGTATTETVRVIDGDGFFLGAKEVRLWGIDAPELPQECVDRVGGIIPCGQHAKRFLDEILKDSELVCETITFDKYGRHISRCTVNGYDLGQLLVRAGWALDFKRYSHGKYAADQIEAQDGNRGLWRTTFLKPEEWRKLK